MTKKEAQAGLEPSFRKDQILQSSRFTPLEKDALQSILDKQEMITITQAKSLLKQFMNKEVM